MFSVINYLKITATQDFVLWHLTFYPLLCFITTDMIPKDNPASPNFFRSRHTKHIVQLYSLIKAGFKQNCALKPVHTALLKITSHIGMDHVFHQLFIFIAGKQELCQYAFLQYFPGVEIGRASCRERV